MSKYLKWQGWFYLGYATLWYVGFVMTYIKLHRKSVIVFNNYCYQNYIENKTSEIRFVVPYPRPKSVNACSFHFDHTGPGLGFFRKKLISSRTPGKKWKKPISSSFVRTKLEKTVKDVRNVGRKYLSYLISYKRLWLKMHLVNWYCLKTWCKNIKYFWSISSSFIRTKLEETGWQIGETLKDVRNTGKN